MWPVPIPIALIHGISLLAGLAGTRLSERRIGFSDVWRIGFVVMGNEGASMEVIQRLRRRWIAVLHQAIEDAKGNVRSVEKPGKNIGGIQREALMWIFNAEFAKRDLVPLALRERDGERETGMPVNGISNGVNSFNSVCGFLDIDPDRARQRLRVVPEIWCGLGRTRLDVGEEGEGLC